MEEIATRYVANRGGQYIAYQVVGGGDVAVVVGLEAPASLHVVWDEPLLARFFRRLASFSTLVLFDRRGVGASDPISPSESPSSEELMDDLTVVMDAAEVGRASLIAAQDGSRVAILFAASSPERVHSMVLINSFARLSAADDYPLGVRPDVQELLIAPVFDEWGGPVGVEHIAPRRAADPIFREWFARGLRLSHSPATAARSLQEMFEIDVRGVLPHVQVPTLVMHSTGDRLVRVDIGRYVAEHIPGARFVELPGDDHVLAAMDLDLVAGHIEDFILGTRVHSEPDRVFATVLFTDIVDSTIEATRRGDGDWHTVLDQHDEIVRRQLQRFSGRFIKATGDGVLATFDGPARAIRCAVALRDGMLRLGLHIRAGLHAGEVELRGDDIAGIGVHIAARVQALAQPGEVLVSRTVVDLVTGSGIACDDRGEHELKGVPGPWRVFAVTDT